MKNELFMAGLIMVAVACSNGDSVFENSIDEKSPRCNISFIFCGYNASGVAAFDLCESTFSETEQTLTLSLSDNGSFVYKADEIKNEFLADVKNNKVTMMFDGKKTIPVVIQKDYTKEFENMDSDKRKFMFESILKKDSEIGDIEYRKLYNGLFIFGFCTPGNKMLKEGCFFFSHEDFTSEITGAEISTDGRYSAGFANIESDADVMLRDKYHTKYKFMVCQAFYEEGYLLIRVENGKTFRYPIELFYNPHHRQVILEKEYFAISAIENGFGNWIPVILRNNAGMFWYNELVPNSSYYYNKIGKKYELSTYREFMEVHGVNKAVGFTIKDPFFDLQAQK